MVADLRGSFTGYGNNSHAERRRHAAVGADRYRPPEFHRPYRRPPRRHAATRGCSARDACWSPPTIPAARTCRPASRRYPIYTTVGGTFGVDQNFNRLQVSGGATVDRTDYQWSKLTDGTSTTQRRPQLQPVRRRRPRQLRSDAGREAVRARCRATAACTTYISTATAMRAIPPAATSRAGTLLRILAAAVRRNLDRLRRARLCRPAAATAWRACSPRPR